MSRIFNYDQIHFNHQNNVDNLIKIYELHYLTNGFYKNYYFIISKFKKYLDGYKIIFPEA